jgi:uncharacterized protein
MKKEITEMMLNLGRVGERETYSFNGIFSIATEESGTAACDTDVTGMVTRRGSRLLLGVRVRSAIRVECSRCLEEFDLRIESGFDLVFHREERARLPEGTDEEDFILLTDDVENRFDIFPRVRESILLELPIRFLCDERCAGLCATCGANLNKGDCGCSKEAGDPRWDDLKKLLSKDETS